jgi:VanZ family protein
MRSNKLYVVAFWLAMVAVLILSVAPMSPPKFNIFSWQDKFHHFAAYGVLCVLAIKSYGTQQPIWKIGLGLVSFGLGIEIIQLSTNYRYGEFMDLVANILGILFAICLSRILRWDLKC